MIAHASYSRESLGTSILSCSYRAHYDLTTFLFFFYIYYGTSRCPWAQIWVLRQQFYWVLSKIIMLCKYYCVFLSVLIPRKSQFWIDVMQLHRSYCNCHSFNDFFILFFYFKLKTVGPLYHPYHRLNLFFIIGKESGVLSFPFSMVFKDEISIKMNEWKHYRAVIGISNYFLNISIKSAL